MRETSNRLGVLVVGDANPDLVLHGDVVPRFGQAEQLLDGAELTLGGSASIVACGVAALDTPTRLAAVVGDDALGRTVLETLARRGVDTTAVRVDPSCPTGMSVILSRPADRAILTHLGTITALRADHVGDDLLAAVAHVHVASYFLQPGLAAGLPGLLARARAAGATTSLDTNWDPSGSWKGLDDVLPLVDVFLPNDAELHAVADALGLAGGDRIARARALHGLGPVVVVKAGADGAAAVGPEGALTAPGLAVDVVDTTGAGDSFDAGFVAAWVRGLPLARCLRWAAAAGSLSTRAAGGITAQPNLAELTRALA